MYRTLLDQLKQVSGSRTYDDTKTMANAESLVDNRLEGDLNYLRTQLRLITGETNWFDAPANDLATLDLDAVCDIGSVTDQDITVDYITASSSGSQLPALLVETDLQVGNDIIVAGNVDGVDLSVWNTAIKTFTGQTNDSDSSPSYTSQNYVTNGDSLEAAIGKLDAGIYTTDVEKEVERIETQINSGSAHPIPNSKDYTLGQGQNMDVYFNGQLLQAHLFAEERDYLESTTTAVKFAFDVPIGSYLAYLIRK